MKYDVRAVEDDELPEGVDRVIVEREDGSAVLLVSGEPARCWRFMRAWEDTLEPREVPTLLYAV
jgi:hypothetical protein